MSTYANSVGAGAQPTSIRRGLRRWAASLLLAAILSGLSLQATQNSEAAGLDSGLMAQLQPDGLQGGSCG